MKKNLGLTALLATLMSLSAPVFAASGVEANLDDSTRGLPRWNNPNPPEWENGGETVCRASNILRQSFDAVGDWRVPARFIARRALLECRQRSFPFIARTCRLEGCRQVGDHGGPGRDMIRIRSAIYGANCNARGGDVSNDVARFCNGRANCAYTVDVARIGDPAFGCRKDFRVDYECGGRVEQAYLAPEANGHTLQIRCGM